MLLTAFILGIAGSFHCAGMCSPLAFAVTNIKKTVWANRLIYNAGRILTYGILGTVVSTIGVALPFEKFQAGLSIGMGVILILIGLVGTGRIKIPYLHQPVNRFTFFLKNKFSFLIQKKNTGSLILLGALNGLLPCGLTFIALTSCLILPDAWDGFYFMVIFGAGTLPVMLGFLSLVQFLIARFKISFQRVNTIMLIAAGGLLIARVAFMKDHSTVISKTTNAIEVCR